MTNSRTKNSVLTMMTSSIRQVLTLILSFASRTIFIHILGAAYLGLNGLFTNILSLLALTELGIGGAISFYLFKPLAEQDTERIKVFMSFYRKCYNIVGLTILGLGCCIMPFLSKFVNFNQAVPENLYVIYFLYLLNSVSSYFFFAYKQTLVFANQEQYKIEKINIAFTFINCISDILVLLTFHNFILYLLFKLLLVITKNVVIAKKINSQYPYLKDKCYDKISKEERHLFFKDIGSISLFKAGSVLMNSTTNIVMSILVGTIVVGYYSNYTMIVSQVTVVFSLIISSVKAGIGNVIAKEDMKSRVEVYKKLDFVVFIIYSFFTICLFCLFNPFIELWVGNVDKGYVLSLSVVAVLCADFYINSSCQILDSFRTGSGHFEIGRSLQIIGGLVNIVLSIFLGKFCGLFGVLLSPVLCKLFITVVPFNLNAGFVLLGINYKKMLGDYAKKILITIVPILLIMLIYDTVQFVNLWISFVFKVMIAIIISLLFLYLINYRRPELRSFYSKFKNKA